LELRFQFKFNAEIQMKHKMLVLSALMSAALVTTSPANADIWDFSYSGAGISGSGEFITGAVGSPYTVTGVTGTANGLGITGLSGYAGADNKLFSPASPGYVDFAGISFSTASGPDWNLFYNGGNFALRSDVDPIGYASNGQPLDILTVTAAVPEPETYAMMLAGLGLLGFVARRRRERNAA
jgi:hypothetical protein